MLKTLLNKQLLEIFNSYFYDAKKNRKRSKASSILYILFFVLIMVGMLGGIFTYLAFTLCGAMQSAGMGWLYFTLLGLIAILLGAFGSVFNTYSGLYLAKDNDLLLSLPIPVRCIMASRLLTVYLMGLMYSGVVMLPAAIVYWCVVPQTFASVVGSLLLVALVALIVLILSCALGWVVAKVSLKLKNKSFIAVLLSLVFVGAYYFFYFKAQAVIKDLIANAAVYGAKIKGSVYPLYLFGRVGEGDWLAIALVTLFVLAAAALTWYVLAHSFLNIATSSGKTARAAYREKAVRPRSVQGALFSKELGRFVSSSNYILNCGFGSILLVLAGAALLWKGSELISSFELLFSDRSGCVPVLICTAICLIASMIDMVVPSVSLEAKTLWLAHSLPITAWQALRAKLSVQLLFSTIPALFCAVCAACVTPLKGVLDVALLLLAPVAFTLLNTVFGLFLGLKFPNLTWTSEIAPIKQSISVMFALFASWILSIAFGGLFLWRGWRIGTNAYLGIFIALAIAAAAALLVWLKKKGARIFAAL